MSQRSVVIVGSGIMGRGIAAIFLRAGWSTQIIDRTPSRWPALKDKVTALAAQRELSGAGRLVCHARPADADFSQAELVIETVAENLALKQELFRELDAIVPEAVPIASNTSGFRISEISPRCDGRGRTAHAHFFMPAHLVPLVELAGADYTHPETIDHLQRIFESVGLVAVRIQKDIAGLLANRMQHALMREAFSLLEQGLATADDIDAAVRYGFGFRYLAAGPLLQKEISGLDTQFASASAIYPDLCNDNRPANILASAVQAGHLGLKTGQGLRPWPAPAVQAETERYDRVLNDAVSLLLRSDRAG